MFFVGVAVTDSASIEAFRSRGFACENGEKEPERDGAESPFLEQFWFCSFRRDSLGIIKVLNLRNRLGKMFPRNSLCDTRVPKQPRLLQIGASF